MIEKESEDQKMKVKVNEDKCIGCGSCVSLTDSKIFDFNDDGKAQVVKNEVKEEDVEIVKTAMEYCPTEAIAEIHEKESNEEKSNNEKE